MKAEAVEAEAVEAAKKSPLPDTLAERESIRSGDENKLEYGADVRREV